jgi:hypothetical protein
VPSRTRETVLLISEIVGLGFTLYIVWAMLLPDNVKDEIRSLGRAARVPFDAAAAERRAHVEMMADVIDLATFGVPAEWARSA